MYPHHIRDMAEIAAKESEIEQMRAEVDKLREGRTSGAASVSVSQSIVSHHLSKAIASRAEELREESKILDASIGGPSLNVRDFEPDSDSLRASKKGVPVYESKAE